MLIIPSAFERTLIYRIVSYRISYEKSSIARDHSAHFSSISVDRKNYPAVAIRLVLNPHLLFHAICFRLSPRYGWPFQQLLSWPLTIKLQLLTSTFELVRASPACQIFMPKVIRFKSYCPHNIYKHTHIHIRPISLPGPLKSLTKLVSNNRGRKGATLCADARVWTTTTCTNNATIRGCS